MCCLFACLCVYVCMYVCMYLSVCNFYMFIPDPSYLTLNASSYHQDISAFAPKGTYILTVGFNISGNSVANISNYHYDLSGYYSDFFKIDRKRGHLTVNAALNDRTSTYSLEVSFFYTVTYTNGTVGHNYTESDIFITAVG